jgi:hypothetical protein
MQLNPCGHSPCILSNERMGWFLMNMLGLCQVYVLHIERVIENSSFYKMYKSSISPGFAKHIVSILPVFISCYIGSLVT